MEQEKPSKLITYKLTHHEGSKKGFDIIEESLNGLQINLETEFDLKSSQDSSALIKIHTFHQLDDLQVLKQYLDQENLDINLIVLTYDTDSSAIDRQTGNKSSKILALRKNILLKEFPLENFTEGQFSFKNDLIITITNLSCYLLNGGGKNSDAQLEATWQRYLHSNIHHKLYQRLFFKNRVIRAQTKTTSLKNKEVYENVPVSF